MYSIQAKRLLRALEIARCLFEDQGYHRIYLNQIAEFIRRKYMYSPKISEELIPALYRVASSKKITMTKLVNQIIRDYLEKSSKIKRREISHEPEKGLGGLQGSEAKGQH